MGKHFLPADTGRQAVQWVMSSM